MVFFGAIKEVYGATNEDYGATEEVYGATIEVYGATKEVYGNTKEVNGVAEVYEADTGKFRWLIEPKQKTILVNIFYSSDCLIIFRISIKFSKPNRNPESGPITRGKRN